MAQLTDKDLKNKDKPMNGAIPLQAQRDKALIPLNAIKYMGYTNPYSWQNDNSIDSLICYTQASIRHMTETLQYLVNLKLGTKFYRNVTWLDKDMHLPHPLLGGWNCDNVYDKSFHVLGTQNLMEDLR
jgi:hypothetical protein